MCSLSDILSSQDVGEVMNFILCLEIYYLHKCIPLCTTHNTNQRKGIQANRNRPTMIQTKKPYWMFPTMVGLLPLLQELSCKPTGLLQRTLQLC